ncbi:MAG TPA: hypothetical protein VN822_07670 [Candidatus Acidoferrales bacterium]|nr:hypothetical protein [Candidatus Acidoferrales bacterium]
MDILWPALGIAVIVVFVFCVLAQHWQRVLRQQAWTIRRLFERVQNLEEMADPEFRRRLSESAPPPLEQVFTLTFRLSDRFWRDALRLTEEDRKYVREYGAFVGSVKLERWRSHAVAIITEVLPDRKATGWQTRTLDYYPDPARSGDALSLWDLALSRPGPSAERPPSLELLIRPNSLELCGHLILSPEGAPGNGHRNAPARDDVVFFRVPLDTAQLAEFRSHDPVGGADNGNGNSGAEDSAATPGSWQAFYSDRNEELGIEWQLRLRDLTRKSEWDRWKILESASVPFAAGEH